MSDHFKPESDKLRRYYERPGIVESCKHSDTLDAAERTILEKYSDSLRDGSILEIGCGGGRLSKHLLKLAGSYTGIDYSEGMVGSCKERFPGQSFFHCDARDMSMFEENRFDVVVFGFNGIDYMPHSDRLGAIGEIARVLRPGGIFIFSSHNLDCEQNVHTFDNNEKIIPKSLLKNARNLLSYVVTIPQHVRTDTYAILSDPLESFGFFGYFIRKTDQVNQIHDLGFENPEVVDQEGQFVPCDSVDLSSLWLYYICRKPESGSGNP